MVIDRVKYQLGYPESAKDMIAAKSLLTAVEQYSMGTERPLSQYMEMVGLNMNLKEITVTKWCTEGMVSSFRFCRFTFERKLCDGCFWCL